MRPYPGVETSESAAKKDKRDFKAIARKQETRGIDALIILIRILLSYGWSIKVDPRWKEYDLDTATTFATVAKADLGWTREEDWKLKRIIVTEIGLNSPNTNKGNGWTFAELSNLQSLHPCQLRHGTT